MKSKRTEVYTKSYKAKEHCPSCCPDRDPKDNIHNEMREIVNSKYQIFDGSAFCSIGFKGGPRDADIEGTYTREVNVEIMPANAMTPKCLISLLSKKRFKKLE